MANWVLIPCAKRLFLDFNTIAPGRDKASDGSIGDTAHQATGTSDHLPDEDTPALQGKDADKVNEVHAIDVDDDLRVSGLTMEMVVQFLLGRCRSGAEKRLRYIIYNRRIWEASNGWNQRAYTGPSPHTEHAHFSFSYDTAREADASTWHLEDIPMSLTADDKAWLADQIDKAATAAAVRVWGTKIPDYADPAEPNRQLTASVWEGYNEGRHITTRQVIGEAVKDAKDEILTALAGVGTPAGTDPEAFAETVATKTADKLAARLKE